MAKLKDLSEMELIQRIQNNDENAFNEIYHRYQKLIFFIANRNVRNEADAMDVLQETFVEIRRSINSLRNPTYFRLWVYRIVNSKCKDLFRSNKFSLVDVDGDFIQNTIKEERKDYLPEKELKFKSDQETLNYYLDRLPESQKMVLILYYMEQLSIKEIASVLQVPEGTVKSRMSTAKISLKADLDMYEARTGVPVSFHSLDQAIPMVLASAFAATKLPGTGLLFHSSKMSQLFTSTALKTVAVLACSSVVVATGYEVYRNYQNAKEPEILTNTTFLTTTKDGIQLETPKSAYFYLLEHACCEKEIKDMKLEELKDLIPIYEILKEKNGYHYQLLKESGWSTAFEQKVLK